MTRRDELIAIVVGLLVLVVGALVAGDGTVPGWEESVFHAVNGLPDWLYPIVWPGNLLGALVIVPIVAVLALSVRQYWLALAIVIAGVLKLVSERIVKAVVTRERPATSIGSDIETRGDVSVSGESFVSGHAILAAAVAMVVAPYVPPRGRIALGLVVVFVIGSAETAAFWQYNRRLFLGFLRAIVFSAVLYVGIAIALGALDQLFGVDVKGETYFRIWLVVAFVVNTWIFLAAVPEHLAALEADADYPRALKVFAQYILTPLAFTYLLILLAYLIKIVAGGEWPSGWIGWLVASVSVTGLLGFLLVHPLRADPAEGWIRTYARWLFIGLVPAALMLLVAFWKRILPYGLTEPRALGLVLGLWLLGIALLFTFRGGASIRTIPITLADAAASHARMGPSASPGSRSRARGAGWQRCSRPPSRRRSRGRRAPRSAS